MRSHMRSHMRSSPVLRQRPGSPPSPHVLWGAQTTFGTNGRGPWLLAGLTSGKHLPGRGHVMSRPPSAPVVDWAWQGRHERCRVAPHHTGGGAGAGPSRLPLPPRLPPPPAPPLPRPPRRPLALPPAFSAGPPGRPWSSIGVASTLKSPKLRPARPASRVMCTCVYVWVCVLFECAPSLHL